MQKWNMSPIGNGHQQKRQVVDIGVPNDWWDIARDLFFCRILYNDPYPVGVNKLSKESINKAHEIRSAAIKMIDFSKSAIDMQSIHMFQALLSSTDNQASRLPISCPGTRCKTGS